MGATSIDKAAAARARELAKIHVGKKLLKLDEETYRALIRRISGELGREVSSAADLDAAGRVAVIEQMGRKGVRWEAQQARSRAYRGKPKHVKARPYLDKVGALLADAKRPWAYAHAMASHMFRGVSRVEWLRDDQLRKLVAALEVDARRRAKHGND